MLDIVITISVIIVLLIGSLFTLVSGLGLLRLPDIYSQMHAASKAGTLGSGFALFAVALHAPEYSIVMRALAGIFFLLLTAPVASHLLARAAYFTGCLPCSSTVVDELKGRYDDHSPHLSLDDDIKNKQ